MNRSDPDLKSIECSSSDEYQSALELLKSCLYTITDNYEQYPLPPNGYVKTGLVELDRMMIGLPLGSLTLIAGSSGSGKTGVICALAQHLAIEEKTNMGIVSLRLSGEQVMMRMIAATGQLDLGQLTSAILDTSAFEKLTHAASTIEKSSLFINDKPFNGVEQLLLLIEAFIQTKQLTLLAIDDFPFRYCADDQYSAIQNSERFVFQLQKLARNLNIAIVLTAGISNRVYNRRDPKPRLSDLSIHGDLVSATDIVWFLYREHLYFADTLRRGIIELSVAKHNQGRLGKFLLMDKLSMGRLES